MGLLEILMLGMALATDAFSSLSLTPLPLMTIGFLCLMRMPLSLVSSSLVCLCFHYFVVLLQQS